MLQVEKTVLAPRRKASAVSILTERIRSRGAVPPRLVSSIRYVKIETAEGFVERSLYCFLNLQQTRVAIVILQQTIVLIPRLLIHSKWQVQGSSCRWKIM